MRKKKLPPKKTKKNKIVVDSHCPEFGYELISALPYAYTLFLQKRLKKTISGFDTSCLYFFSRNHQETKRKRAYKNRFKTRKMPNINIHRNQLDWKYFTPPPLKKFYQKQKIKFSKETVVIFNRYNSEWGGPPINYLDLPTLDTLFNMLHEKYQVVYINVNRQPEYFDQAPPWNLNEESILKKYPNVLTIDDLLKKYPGKRLNEIQVRLFAACTKYISSNGGQVILSAYFGGENIIFSKRCREIQPHINSFFSWYHKFGGGTFQHVNNYNDLIALVKHKWIEKKPLINILIRTSNRPRFFAKCLKSIYAQTYKNYNILISVDNKNTFKYAKSAKGRIIQVDYTNHRVPKKKISSQYGPIAKYNLYINDLHKHVKTGYIMYLDDDNVFSSKHSLQKIADNIQTNRDLLFWKVKFNRRIVPNDKNFSKPPVSGDIDSAGFLYPHNYKKNWEPYRKADYRLVNRLYNIVPNKVYINETLTAFQSGGHGKGLRRDLGEGLASRKRAHKISFKPHVKIGAKKYNRVKRKK